MKNKKYLQIAFYVFLTFVACFLFYTAVENSQKIGDTVNFWAGLLSPIAIGFVIAYLANFIMKFCEKQLKKWKLMEQSPALRGLSVFLSYIILLVVVVLVLLLIVPQLVSSLTNLLADYDLNSLVNKVVSSVSGFMHRLVGNNQFLLEQVDTRVVPMLNGLLDAVIDIIPGLIPGVVGVVSGITTGISNLLIGFVISVYLLMDKERLCARVKKMTLAFLKKERGDQLIGLIREVNETVGEFLSGKLLECFIMCVISFFAYLVAGVELPLLLAAIMGITNIVPFFGPVVGMVLGGILLLLVHPADFWIFIILSLVLLQLDGNIVGPKILGKSTGLDALWIVVAILLGGGLFGIWGVLLGVPFFAVAYALLRHTVNRRLESTQMSVVTEDYVSYEGKDPGLDIGEGDKAPRKERGLLSSLFAKLRRILTKRLKKK